MSRIVILAVISYVCWLSMMTLHELGHVFHALLSRGRIERVQIPLWGFSQTEYSNNPHPLFVAWGGVIWGSLLPLIALMILRRTAARGALLFFAGFCLIANGVYLGVGGFDRVGDAGDLLQYGAPLWTLCGFGLLSFVSGLVLWYRLGPFRALLTRTSSSRPLQ